jgi:hypothetical protein
MLAPFFAGELFGPGQPLDASKYYIILPDSIGHGKSAKPSDGMRAQFPPYNYEDMVEAEYRLVSEGLGVPSSASRARFFDGRYAHLDLGRKIPRLYGRTCAYGVATHRNVCPQLDDATPDH